MGTHTNKKNVDESRLVMDSFRRIVQALRNSSQQSQKYSGLTSAQLFILSQIENSKSLSMNALADLTFTHQSTVSEAVGRLVARGLVSKLKDPEDSRSVLLTLTKKGFGALTVAPKTAQQNLASAIHSMKSKKRAALAQLLVELVHEANLSHEPAHLFFEQHLGKRSKNDRT